MNSGRTWGRVLWATAMAVMVSATLVTAQRSVQQGDEFQTSGGNEVADARRWWANPTAHTDQFRDQTRRCLALLEEAESHRQTAMRYKDQAKAPGPMSSQERTRLNEMGNAEYAIVTRIVRQFYECARPKSDQFNTAGAKPEPSPAWRTNLDPMRFTEDYAHGVIDGIGGCLKGFVDIAAGLGYFILGDDDNAAREWGLQPGQSITLAAFSKEFQDTFKRTTAMSAYESGAVGGRRLCAVVIVPALAKKAGAKIDGATRGRARANPLVPDQYLGKVANETPAQLEGSWVRTPDGPVQLGKPLGEPGYYGSAFQQATDPTRVIKIGRPAADAAASFPRQLEGSEWLKREGIATPDIHKVYAGGPGKPPILIMDHVNKKWPTATFYNGDAWLKATPAERAAIRDAAGDVHFRVAKAGRVLGDGHRGNVAFARKPDGTFEPIIVDADLVVPEGELANGLGQGGVPGNHIFAALAGSGFPLESLYKINNAAGLTRWLMDARYQPLYDPRNQVGTPMTGTVQPK